MLLTGFPHRNRVFLMAAAAYVIVLLGSAGLMRPLLLWSRSVLGGVYSPALNGLTLAAGCAFLFAYRSRLWPLERYRTAGLGVLALCYGLALRALTIPEERYHLVQYGLLSVLLTEGWRGVDARKRHGYSLLMVMGVGVVDEGVQWLLPNRVGDPRDVLLNWTSAILAQAALILVRGDLSALLHGLKPGTAIREDGL